MNGSANRRAGARRAAGLCAAAVLAGAGCTDARTSSTTSPATARPTVSSDLQNAYEKVVRNVLPSVVQITTGNALGSGVVFDTAGDIVTNAHVVGEAQRFKVALATGTATLDATLVGTYPEDDLAVIRLAGPPKGLRPAAFADSSTVEVGQITLAMGNPLGLSSSVTEGIVSAVGRTVSEPASGGQGGATIPNMVQTSASINPGNSGGALVNLSGQVIGIPTLAAADPELGGGAAPGIGFAIPSSTVTSIAGQLARDGRVTDSGRAALGVSGRTVLGTDLQPEGVAVVSVVSGGAADRAGIRPGDIVTRIGSTPVTTNASLAETLAGLRPGQRVEVTYERDGDTRTAEVTLTQL